MHDKKELYEVDVMVNHSIHELSETLRAAIETHDNEYIVMLFEELHTYDQYLVFDTLDGMERRYIFQTLPPANIAKFFSEIDVDKQYELIKEMDDLFASNVLGEMDADDAADVIGEFSAGDAAALFSQMDADDAAEIKDLLIYDEDTAGAKMTTAVITVNMHDTVKDAMKKLTAEAPDAETIYVIYALDNHKKLVGVMSLKDLILARANEIIEDVMSTRIIQITVDEDQEVAARLIQDYDLTALPVVDMNNHLLGIITVDDVIDVIKEEAEDDYLKLAGVGESDDLVSDFKILPSLRIRLPWLVSMVFLEGIVVFILQIMNNVTSNLFGQSFVVLIASAIVLVNNMSGVPGIQTAALAIVHYNNGELDDKEMEKKFFRIQTVVILLSGIAIGIAAFTVGMIVNLLTISSAGMSSVVAVALAVGIAACFASYISSFIALAIVVLLRKYDMDPAAASGPLMSTIGDVIAAIVYTFTAVFIIIYVFGIF